MSFSLGKIGDVIGGIAAPLTGGLSNIISGAIHPPSAPNLPNAPTLTAPQFPNYPGLTPQQQQILQQQQQGLTQFGNVLGNFGQNPYQQQQGNIANQELSNYSNALQGNNPPSQAIEQQKARDWKQTIEQAGQQGIRLSGDTPESAVSESTAGNQIIQDFNKRYGYLTQQYNLGQQQIGQQAFQGGLGLASQALGTQAGAYGQYGNAAQNLYAPYQQQQLGQFGVQTQQALTNADIANQNATNQYQGQLGQTTANYNNALLGYNQNLGLLNNILGIGGSIIGRGLTSGGTGNNQNQQNQGPNASYTYYGQSRNPTSSGAGYQGSMGLGNAYAL
jgi:hypothetical protein